MSSNVPRVEHECALGWARMCRAMSTNVPKVDPRVGHKYGLNYRAMSTNLQRVEHECALGGARMCPGLSTNVPSDEHKCAEGWAQGWAQMWFELPQSFIIYKYTVELLNKIIQRDWIEPNQIENEVCSDVDKNWKKAGMVKPFPNWLEYPLQSSSLNKYLDQDWYFETTNQCWTRVLGTNFSN